MKKLASILVSVAVAFGLMVPAVAFADDGIGNVAIEYNGKRINLKPQVDEASHSLMVKFQVETDDAKYQNYVQAGFMLSPDARSGRIAQSDVAGSTVTAVVSNGESPLKFVDNTLFLGTLTVNVDAKLGPGDGTGARIVVLQMDSTDETFGAPFMHAMDTRDSGGELISVESRSVPFSLPSGVYTGSAVPSAVPSGGSGSSEITPMPTIQPGQLDSKPASEVEVGLGQMVDGSSVDSAALKSLGSDILQKVKEQLDDILAGKGFYPGLTNEQLQKIAEVIEAAGGNLADIDVAVIPSVGELSADDVKEDIALLDQKIPGASLLSIYDLKVTLEVSFGSITTGPMEITELTEPVTFMVKVPENALTAMDIAVGYVHNGEAFVINQGVKPILQSNTVEFPASYFSTYAVYGKEKAAVPNAGPTGSLVQTNDGNPLLVVAFAILTIVGFAGAVVSARRRFN